MDCRGRTGRDRPCPGVDSRQDRPEETLARSEEFQTILKLLDAIDERDARVLRLRFGLEGQEPLTLKQIGEEVGLTRERVRQIEVDALRRLQSHLMDDRPTRFMQNGRVPEASSPREEEDETARQSDQRGEAV